MKSMSATIRALFICFFHHSLASSPTASGPAFPQEALPTSSGYLPVDSTTSSAIFYVFYEAQNSSSPLSQTPILIWLQGGPGRSSLLGNFFELGPYRVNEQLVLEPNLGSWNRLFGLIFLDNPIGVGFSIASALEDIPRDQHAVAKHLFAAITGFIALDPGFKDRPIYVTGESYAGKYVPAIGYYILKKNTKLPISKRVNLKGVAIGSGLTDPLTQVQTHAVNAYFSGFINEKQKWELEEAQWAVVKLVKIGNWSGATEANDEALKLLLNMTGLATYYNFAKKVPYRTDLVAKFLHAEEVKKALGASVVFDLHSDAVSAALHADVMKSVKYMVEFLVKDSKVLLYQGHLDLIAGVVSTEAWVKTMKWEGIGSFFMAERRLWKVNGVLAGYVQKWGGLSHAVVLGAGHFVPTDQSLNSQAMIEDWVLDKGAFADKDEKNSESVPGK